MNIRDTNLEIMRLLGLDQLKGVMAVNVRLRPQKMPIVTVQFFGTTGATLTDKTVKKFRLVGVEEPAK
ncbi:MAG: hypothetical protein KA777_01265 [Rhodoferax sp.]|nr:hypothetical protein [Rhodoferax sp.]